MYSPGRWGYNAVTDCHGGFQARLGTPKQPKPAKLFFFEYRQHLTKVLQNSIESWAPGNWRSGHCITPTPLLGKAAYRGRKELRQLL